MKPLVSLVMPVWRPHPQWFPEAVDSALSDPGCTVELIVVDDGNERPVREVLRTADSRVRHVRVEHGGVAAARNAGTAAARGTHVRYIDADDVVAAGSTGELLHLAGDNRIGCLGTALCDEQMMPYRELHTDLNGDAVRACLVGPFDVRIVSLLFPRWVVTAAGDFDAEMRLSEDWDFVLRCLEQAPLRAGSGIATYYRRHGASATRSANAVEDAEFGARRVLEKWLERHPQQRRSTLHRHARAAMEASYAGAWLDRGDYPRFLQRAVIAALCQPSRLPALARVGLRRTASRVARGLNRRRRKD